jgi:hypothetical protein
MRKWHKLAMASVSHNALHRHMGPMQLRDIDRIVNKAIYASYGWRD